MNIPIEISNDENNQISDYTHVKLKPLCSKGFPLFKASNANRFFFNEIEITLDSIVIFIVLSCVFVTFLITFVYLTKTFTDDTLYKFFRIELIVSCTMFVFSYISASCTSSGIYTITYEDSSPYISNEVENCLTDFASEISNSCMHIQPYLGLSNSSIIRDNICNWTNNPIGQRNHKQFIIMSFWGFVYCLSAVAIFCISDLMDTTPLAYSLAFVCVIVELCFGVAFLITFIGHMYLVLASEETDQNGQKHTIMQRLRKTFCENFVDKNE